MSDAEISAKDHPIAYSVRYGGAIRASMPIVGEFALALQVGRMGME
jgi:hypothetical protein